MTISATEKEKEPSKLSQKLHHIGEKATCTRSPNRQRGIICSTPYDVLIAQTSLSQNYRLCCQLSDRLDIARAEGNEGEEKKLLLKRAAAGQAAATDPEEYDESPETVAS
ncbi:MAG: hypothetical protein CYPHOPRED_002110 [Cyphobasidiales sp. Tagirdzhanova-0007]|nr:MAG: hypothetical protein CYPHOPRED_002110 [Cyphobasidiales sp. Tagirdzhanova-0007]